MAKRHRVEVGAPNVERISNLPSNIIDHMFTYMSLGDTVRTSILSKDWRNKWVTTPHIIFNDQFKLPLSGKQKPENIISRMLLLHKGSILKFSILGAEVKNHHSVDSWLNFLERNPVEDLTIELEFLPNQIVKYILPNHLYRFDLLTDLNLLNVEIKPPEGFKGFSKLVKLELTNCQIDYEHLKIFLANCPVLESFDLYGFEKSSVWSLDISAPNLKSFSMWGAFSSIHFANAKIEEIEICYDFESFYQFGIHDFIGTECKLTETFSHLPYIKKLLIGPGFIQFLAMSSVVQTLQHNLDYLTILEMSGHCFRSINDATALLCLIRSSPNLQHLTVMAGDADEEETIVEYLEEQRFYNVHLEHLKIVDINGISGLETEIEFVKIILSWATALEKMKIDSYFDTSDMSEMLEKDMMIEEILNFDRASPNAEILIP